MYLRRDELDGRQHAFCKPFFNSEKAMRTMQRHFHMARYSRLSPSFSVTSGFHMDSVTVTQSSRRICSRCSKSRPIEEFRFANREMNRRHSECGTCRSNEDRLQRTGNRRRTVQRGLRKIRRLKSPEAITAVIEQVASSFGGLHQFAQAWVDLATSNDVSANTRLKAMSTLLHLIRATDLHTS